MPHSSEHLSTESAALDGSAESVVDHTHPAALIAALSRRLFGKRMLVAIPVAAAALLTETPQVAEAGTDGDWAQNGNAISDTTKFLGTTNSQPLIIKTNNSERVRILANGNVGVGLTAPNARLHVKYTGLNGVRGETSATTPNASGVLGELTSTTPGTGAAGVRGVNNATNGSGVGVYGSHAGSGFGVYGKSVAEAGVRGEGRTGVFGGSNVADGTGVIGVARGPGTPFGVYAIASAADGSPAGYAGVFSGNVSVDGTLSKSGGSFIIDHPLDPEHKTLSHSFVESPDMKNVYDGVATLDANGQAEVTFPEWFDTLNRDFRYQLTCIGGFAPVYIANEIAGNRFRIAGGQPGMKVSWQVTGIRQDVWANANRIPVEQDKPATEQGTYLTPREHGQPEHKGHNYERLQRVIGKGRQDAPVASEAAP